MLEQARLVQLQTDLAAEQAACEAEAAANTGPATLYYLHTDHLGRPKLATNDNGEVVWDGALTTPFGQGITTMVIAKRPMIAR